MTYEEIIESRIQEAMAAGAFRTLPGEGRPLPFRSADQLAGDQWLGFKMLRDADLLPDWLLQAKEIEQLQERLREIDHRHEEMIAAARKSGEWERFMAAIRSIRQEYEAAARSLRRKQDRFNHDAPSIHLERPGIWIEHHLERLDTRISSPLDARKTSPL